MVAAALGGGGARGQQVGPGGAARRGATDPPHLGLVAVGGVEGVRLRLGRAGLGGRQGIHQLVRRRAVLALPVAGRGAFARLVARYSVALGPWAGHARHVGLRRGHGFGARSLAAQCLATDGLSAGGLAARRLRARRIAAGILAADSLRARRLGAGSVGAGSVGAGGLTTGGLGFGGLEWRVRPARRGRGGLRPGVARGRAAVRAGRAAGDELVGPVHHAPGPAPRLVLGLRRRRAVWPAPLGRLLRLLVGDRGGERRHPPRGDQR
uniref:Uncharacterized protein n=1 Tax=Nonomuraea gerenzanensis TaxID=93944 RepID=A0A1M4EPI3_9ACTN|nr:hypothetical protein BN4615_P10256 [Nonomuraea gerenzanensis]